MIYYYSVYEDEGNICIVFAKDREKLFRWLDKSRIGVIKLKSSNGIKPFLLLEDFLELL